MTANEKRTDYQSKVEAQLKEWGSQIDEWRDKATAESQEFLTDLNTKRLAVSTKLTEIQDSADDRWEDFKTDLDEAVDDLKKTVDNVRDRIS